WLSDPFVVAGLETTLVDGRRHADGPAGRETGGAIERKREDQRFEYCGALRAFLRPAFLRSTTRASRVRKPAFFSAGRLCSSSIAFSARAMPRRSAPAWPLTPPPVMRATTSKRPSTSTSLNGELTSCWCTLFGK